MTPAAPMRRDPGCTRSSGRVWIATSSRKSFSPPGLVHAKVGGLSRRNLILAVPVLLLLAMTLGSPALAAPQVASPKGNPTGASQDGTDVVDVGILVVPLSADTAHVAVAYHHPVPHRRVKQAITRLSSATGWSVSDLAVVDDHINRDPITTTALFTLRNAPQEPGGIPALLPYLQAFQDVNRIEVIFTNLMVPQYQGVMRFDSPALSVQLVQFGQGTARYDADIHDHRGRLPALPAGVQGVLNPTRTAEAGTAVRHPASVFNGNSLLLVLAGLALVVGTGSYLWLIRRLPSRSSARILRL